MNVNLFRNALFVAIGLFTLFALVIALSIFSESTAPWVGIKSDPTPEPPKSFVEVRLYQQEKTLWDWLQLLLVPLAVVIVGSWFTVSESRRQEHIASERAQDASLQSFFTEIRNLILDEVKETSSAGDLKRAGLTWDLARSITTTTLRQVTGRRRVEIVTFLYEANLIRVGSLKSISLVGAELSNVDLSNLDLRGIDLAGARLVKANLSGSKLEGASFTRSVMVGANIEGANLARAVLVGANCESAKLRSCILDKSELGEADFRKVRNLTIEQLIKANRLHAAIMPDGGVYDGRYYLPEDLKHAKRNLVDTRNVVDIRKWHLNAGAGQ